MALGRSIICSIMAASLVLSACAGRPAATYHRYTPANQPPGAAAPMVQPPQPMAAQAPQPAAAGEPAKPADAAATKPATFQVPPGGASQPPQAAEQAPAESDIVHGTDMTNNYVIPAVMIVGTVVAAGLFWWGNTHWFE